MRELSFSDLHLTSGGFSKKDHFAHLARAYQLDGLMKLLGGPSGVLGCMGATTVMQMLGINGNTTAIGVTASAIAGGIVASANCAPGTTDFGQHIAIRMAFSAASGAVVCVADGLGATNAIWDAATHYSA